MNEKPSKAMIIRIFIVMLVVVIVTASVSIIRLVNISIINGEKYQNAAMEQQLYDTLLTAPRGDI